MKFALALLSSFLPVTASAHAHIRDPQHILEQADRFEERPPFESAFSCGTTLLYERHRCASFCEPFQCREICDSAVEPETRVTVGACDGSSVSMLSGGEPWIRVSREGYATLSFLRAMLSAPTSGQFEKPNEPVGKNYVTVDGYEYSSFTLRDGRSLRAMRIDFTYFAYVDNRWLPSFHSLVIGKARETQGMFLEHRVSGLRLPLAKLVGIEDALSGPGAAPSAPRAR